MEGDLANFLPEDCSFERQIQVVSWWMKHTAWVCSVVTGEVSVITSDRSESGECIMGTFSKSLGFYRWFLRLLRIKDTINGCVTTHVHIYSLQVILTTTTTTTRCYFMSSKSEPERRENFVEIIKYALDCSKIRPVLKSVIESPGHSTLCS